MQIALGSGGSAFCGLAFTATSPCPLLGIVIETSTGSLCIDVLLICRPHLFIFFSLDMHAHSRWRSGHSLNTRRAYRHKISDETSRLGSVPPGLWCRPALAAALPMAHWHCCWLAPARGPALSWLARLAPGRAICMAPSASSSCVSRGSWWLGPARVSCSCRRAGGILLFCTCVHVQCDGPVHVPGH